MMDKFKLIISVLLVIAGIVGFYFLESHALIFRVLAVLVGLVLAALLFRTTASGQTFYTFVGDSVAEAKRVVWPSRKETVQTTIAVFVLVLLVAIFLWVIDTGFMWLVRALMERGA